MSGEELRAAAIQGKHDRIHTILKDRANTCSADQYGLTPLMYACWNGHVECVKFLVSNPMGVDADGKKRSCVNMVSCKGYTALHLTALDCPEKNVKEIATVLLMMGCDPTIKCRDGLTAHDIALKLSNSAVLRAYKEWNEQDHNMDVRMLLDDTRRQLKAKYTFNINLRMTVDPIDVNFNMPGFIYEPQRQGYIPEELKIYENHISGLIDEGFYYKEGTESLRCLNFAQQQADVSQNRRAELLSRGDSTWTKPDVKDPRYIPAKRRRGRRGNHTLNKPTPENNTDSQDGDTTSTAPSATPATNAAVSADK